MKKLCAVLFCLAAFGVACEPEEINTDCMQVSLQSAAFTGNASFDAGIDSLSLDGNELWLRVAYGGGCDPAQPELHAWGSVLPTASPLPVYQVDMTLEEDDPCEALLRKEFCLNLNSLRQGTASGQLILTLAGDTVRLDWE